MLLPALLATFLFFSSAQAQQFPKYEMRAAWIATVDNIDWPSRGNYDPEKQQQEFKTLLDMHQRNGMNAVVVQVRPATDAFYPSEYEPWSEWLTGKQGRAPQPYYDPLAFMVEETHKRGMEFHAWFNPYRAVFNIRTSSIAPDHISRKKPEWFLTYGDKKYFDPGNPEVRKHLTEVISDVVRRYDIDAVHFDDYFYPYRIPGKEFPDYASYKKYGNNLSRDDWRRSNTDSIIHNLFTAIRTEKPWVKFGVSPFGVWRNNDKDPDGSPTKGGLSNYDDLYADILLWLELGWIDYVVPQLYWERGHKLVAYEILLDWWAGFAYGKHLYIGHGLYRTQENVTAAWRNKQELPEQIRLLREYPEVQGSMYFSTKSFLNNPNGWNDSLRLNYYKYKALVPSMSWMDTTRPEVPSVEEVEIKENKAVFFVKRLSQQRPIRGFVLYRGGNEAELKLKSAEQLRAVNFSSDSCSFEEVIPEMAKEMLFQVCAISHNSVESAPSVTIRIIKTANNTWEVAEILP